MTVLTTTTKKGYLKHVKSQNGNKMLYCVFAVTTLLLEGPDCPSQSSKGFCKLSFFFELSAPGPGIPEL